MSSPFAAANAYSSLARLASGGSAVPTPPLKPKDDTAGGFAGLVQGVLGDVITSGRTADAKTQAMAVGKTDLVDVVTAVAETEVAVETLVSVRDKVIQAYEEIMRMPI